MERALLEKMIVSQVTAKPPYFKEFYCSLLCSVLSTPSLHLTDIHNNPGRTAPSNLLEIHFTVILPSKPMDSMPCLLFRNSNQKVLCISRYELPLKLFMPSLVKLVKLSPFISFVCNIIYETLKGSTFIHHFICQRSAFLFNKWTSGFARESKWLNSRSLLEFTTSLYLLLISGMKNISFLDLQMCTSYMWLFVRIKTYVLFTSFCCHWLCTCPSPTASR